MTAPTASVVAQQSQINRIYFSCVGILWIEKAFEDSIFPNNSRKTFGIKNTKKSANSGLVCEVYTFFEWQTIGLPDVVLLSCSQNVEIN